MTSTGAPAIEATGLVKEFRSPADAVRDRPTILPAPWLWAQGGVAVLLNTILESPW